MYKSNEDIDLWSGNDQIQPWKFEPLKSGLHLVKINLSGSDLTRWRIRNQRVNKVTYQQRKNRPHGLVSLSEHVENYPSKIVTKLMNTGYLRVFALFYFVNWGDVYFSLLSVREADNLSASRRWVVLWEFLALKPILLMLFYMPCRSCFRPYNFKGYGVFKG